MKHVAWVLTLGFLFFAANTGVLAENTGIMVTDLLPEDIPIVVTDLLPEDIPQEAVLEVSVSISPKPVEKGNKVHVSSSYAPQSCPLKATCFFILPTTPPGLYKETMIFSRQYACSTTTHGCGFDFFVPDWIQIAGTGIAIVNIDGLGYGWDTVEIY